MKSIGLDITADTSLTLSQSWKRSRMQGDSTLGQLANSEWASFMAKLEAAEHEFAQGHPAAFKALWSHSDDVSICGAFGGVESGWDKVASRLDWASSQFSDGTRTREEIRSRGRGRLRLPRPDRADSIPRPWPDGRIDSRPAGDDGVSPRGGRMANRSSAGRFTEEHSAAMRTGKTDPSNTRFEPTHCNIGGSARIR